MKIEVNILVTLFSVMTSLLTAEEKNPESNSKPLHRLGTVHQVREARRGRMGDRGNATVYVFCSLAKFSFF